MRGTKAKALRRALFVPADEAEDRKLPLEQEQHLTAAKKNIYRRAKRFVTERTTPFAQIVHSARSAVQFFRQGVRNQMLGSDTPMIRNPLDDLMGA